MATTNNIGLYCFDTGNEDAKTSLEALFGAGNSNMKKIDDAIGELRENGGGLPSFAPEDAGKFLRVDSNGNIVAEAIAYAEGESF